MHSFLLSTYLKFKNLFNKKYPKFKNMLSKNILEAEERRRTFVLIRYKIREMFDSQLMFVNAISPVVTLFLFYKLLCISFLANEINIYM